MSNVIQIKHGQNTPGAGVLAPYELGYIEDSSEIVIGTARTVDAAGNVIADGKPAGIKVEHARNAEKLGGISSGDYALKADIKDTFLTTGGNPNSDSQKSKSFPGNWVNDLNLNYGYTIPNSSFTQTQISIVDENSNTIQITGWKVPKTGFILLSASLYIGNNGGKKAGIYVYIRKKDSDNIQPANEEAISSYYGGFSDGVVNSGVTLKYVNKDDIIYLRARAENGTSATYTMNHSTSGLVAVYVQS